MGAWRTSASRRPALESGFLVGGEGHFEVEQWRRASRPQGLQRQEQAGDGSLHVGGAAAVNPAALDRAAEGAAVSPPAGDRHHVIVRVEMKRLPGARGRELAEDIEARIRPGFRWKGLFELGRGQAVAAEALQPSAASSRSGEGRDRIVIFSGRVDGGNSDNLPEPPEEVGGMAVDVGGGRHAGGKAIFAGEGGRGEPFWGNKIDHTGSAGHAGENDLGGSQKRLRAGGLE